MNARQQRILLQGRARPLFERILNDLRSNFGEQPKRHVTRWIFKHGVNRKNSAAVEWSRLPGGGASVTRQEVKSLARGIGRTPCRRVILAAVYGWGGMCAVRAMRRPPQSTFGELFHSAVRDLEAAVQDAAWMTEEEAERFLRAMRPHTTDDL